MRTSARRTGRLRILAALATITLGAVACSTLDAPVSAPLSSWAAPEGVPVATQTNVSPFPLLERLGRWNGSTFVPVGPDSLTGGRVVVMTHGWAAGLLATYEAAQADSTGLVTMWDPSMVVPSTGERADTLFAGLAADLAGADPTATVLMFSWVDQSATETSALAAFAPERATEVNGNRMAAAIELALAPGFSAAGGRLHLIGHSFGANVATTAALALGSSLAQAPRQLTLFDSPEVELARIAGAKNDLRYKLPRLDIGRTGSTTFVDNYISLVGEPYSGYPGLDQVVDVRLDPPSSDSGVQKHGFPIGWYGASATDPTSDVGLWWSPLLGANVTELASSWEQTSPDPTQQLQLRSTGAVPAAEPKSSLTTTGRPIAEVLDVDAATPVANMSITTDEDSLWLDFDVSFSGSPTDTLHLFIDGRERSTMVPTAPVDGRPSRFVILYDLEPGTHTVSLAVEGETEGSSPSATATARLSQVSISSMSGIERDNTPRQTQRLIVGVLVLVLVAIVLVIAVIVLGTIGVVRHLRRRSSGPSDDRAVGSTR
jgi:pimeloyl-ACP methyl ester carboxylesterase